MILTAILIIAALILVNAIYVGAEFSAVGVRRSRIRQFAGNGNRSRRGCCRSPNRRRRSIATSPRVRSASRSFERSTRLAGPRAMARRHNRPPRKK